MFSGKTESARLWHKRAIGYGLDPVCIKWTSDTRNEGITTHNNQSLPAIPFKLLCQALESKEVKKSRFVIIDEGQFFDDLVEGCEKLLKGGKRVLVTALSGDRFKKPFAVVSALIPLADDIMFLRAICKCGKDAPFSYCHKKITGQKVIGGSEMYESLCRECWDAAMAKDSQ